MIDKRPERPCEALFEWLAKHNPTELCDYADNRTLSAGMRSLAIEAIGLVDNKSIALAMASHYLKSAEQQMEREVAVYALRKVGPMAINYLRDALLTESSPYVREAIEECIEHFVEEAQSSSS